MADTKSNLLSHALKVYPTMKKLAVTFLYIYIYIFYTVLYMGADKIGCSRNTPQGQNSA